MAKRVKHPINPGDKFGRLTIICELPQERQGGGTMRYVRVRCECGAEKTSQLYPLLRGRTRSCGCWNKEKAITHGMHRTRTYQSWRSMIARVSPEATNPFFIRYYRDLGITVCDRWRKFENFLADMGERPAGKTLDRWPDQNGNYEPSNCRWATPAEQGRNRRDNVLVDYNGQSLCFTVACEAAGLDRDQVGHFVSHHGVSHQEAFDRFRSANSSSKALILATARATTAAKS